MARPPSTSIDSFLEPVARESTPSIIARKLRQAVASGAFAPGTQLAEAELARALGVSRGPLREAMQRLTQEGLLLSIQNRGLFVIELTEADVHDVYTARSAVERAAAAELLKADYKGGAAQLRSVTDEMAQAQVRQDSAGVADADFAFHELLVQLSGSPRLARMHQTLLTETRMCVRALKDKYPESDTRVAEHQGIVSAIEAGDAQLADELIIAHMTDAVRRLAPGGLESDDLADTAPDRPTTG